MKIVFECISGFLFFIACVAVMRTILTRRFPFVCEINNETKQAYLFLVIAAIAILAWSSLHIHVQSLEIAGVKATVGQLQQRVQSLSEQMEVFFKNKKIESFSAANWSRVRTVRKLPGNVVLGVTLEQEPIPGSIEVFEGVLLMPETQYHLSGRDLEFPANTNTPENGLTIKYYPRVALQTR